MFSTIPAARYVTVRPAAKAAIESAEISTATLSADLDDLLDRSPVTPTSCMMQVRNMTFLYPSHFASGSTTIVPVPLPAQTTTPGQLEQSIHGDCAHRS